MGAITKVESRMKRKKRVKSRIKGTPERPRLSVFKTSKHIYAQIIDDTVSRTLASASSLCKEIRTQIGGKGGSKEGAAMIGNFIAKRASQKGIKKVVFDRNGFIYHGRVKALAEAAREHGLEF